MIIGITGGTGGGKSTVSDYLRETGYKIIDADKIAHSVMDRGTMCLEEVSEYFGTSVLNDDGSLNRKRLGGIVFNDKEKLKKLNDITYKYIIGAVKSEITSDCVIDAVGLVESGLNKLCDKTIFVYCPYEIRINRIVERDKIDREYALSRIKSQKSDEFYEKNTDYKIVNDGKCSVVEQLRSIFGEKIY